MRHFRITIRESGPARFTTALLTALLITSATFLPLLAHSAVANPVPAPAPAPNPNPKPDPQAGRPTTDGLYPDPEPCRGNCSWVHDPSIVYENNKYWRFSTSGNIAIASAPSLDGPWRYEGALLHNGTSIQVHPDQDIWVSLSRHFTRHRRAKRII
jgi:arabinan endo-1,5-alpha-L-arabinosidase